MRFITFEALFSLLVQIIEISKSQIKSENLAIFKGIYNELLKNIREMFRNEKNISLLCEVFTDQNKFYLDYIKEKPKKLYRIISNAAILLGNSASTKIPDLLRFPATPEFMQIEIFRKFLTIRNIIPLLFQANISIKPDIFPFTQITKKSIKMTIISLINSGNLGVECFECKNNILMNRILLEIQEGLLLIEPKYEESIVAVGILAEFKFIDLVSNVSLEDARKLILKTEDSMNKYRDSKLNKKSNCVTIELVFEDASKAVSMNNTILSGKQKYAMMNTTKIENYLKSCELPE